MTARDRLDAPGPKKLLALDGGGIRGMMTVEVLAEIEAMLRNELDRPDLVLADFFDYIGGTSTGAIIAAGLAKGMDSAQLREFYEESGPAMFDKSSLLKRFRYKYEDEALAATLQDVFGADTVFGSEKIRTLLLMVLRNATTDSPWPLSNNPEALYNNTGDDNDNLRIPLWQLIRASTAAPTYFPPEEIRIGANRFLFVDGGVTMYNNPAFQLFLMATIPAFKVEWPTGESQMLLVSVGTGYAANANRDLAAHEMNLLYNAGSIPSALMDAALHEQDTLCRVFGRCLLGNSIDREIKDLMGTLAPGGSANHFTYLRYNADLSRDGLDEIGLPRLEPRQVQKLDSIDGIADLQEVGRRVAETVAPEHYRGFLSGMVR